MVHALITRRLLLVTGLAFAAGSVLSAPAAGAATGATTTTIPVVHLPGATTTTTTKPASSPTTAKPAATTTTKPAGPGVPTVPVGGPPTTTTTVKPGAKPAAPAPPPDPNPIIAQVDTDLAQLNAIADFKPAQDLVAKAQTTVTQAGATLLVSRHNLDAAQTVQSTASKAKALADAKLRELAVAAYIGVGFAGSGFSDPSLGGHGVPAADGMESIDAKEMLVTVGEHARQGAQTASQVLDAATKATRAAAAAYQKQQAVVSAAEAQLLAAQQTLKIITTAATTPGAAAATSLPDLLSAAGSTKPAPTTTSTTASPTTTVPGLQAAETAAGYPVTTINGAAPTSPTILGKPMLDQAQLQAWWATLSRTANVTVPVNTLIASYAKWGQRLGIRDDIAFAQSIVETGYFSFPAFGQLTPKDNNFAGIGACDTCSHGWTFPNADQGVEAQLELLHLYATSTPWPKTIPNVIGATSVGGCCDTWAKLAGTWASSTVYGISIMTVYHQMLSWLIPQQELAAGLIAPSNPAAKGPELAPLPGPPAKTPAKGTSTTTAPKSVSAAARRG